MKRRSFLAGLIVAASAPAIVRASSMMPLWVPKKEIVLEGIAPLDPAGRLPESSLQAIQYRGCATREQILQFKPEAGHMYTVTNSPRPLTMLSDGKEWLDLFSVAD